MRWKQAQVGWQKYRDTVWEYSNEIRKAKPHVESNLARNVKSNKKGFCKYTNSKKKTRENVDLQLKGARNLVTGAWKQPRYSMPPLPCSLLVGFPFRKWTPWAHWKSWAMNIYPPLRTEWGNIETSWTYASSQNLMECIHKSSTSWLM